MGTTQQPLPDEPSGATPAKASLLKVVALPDMEDSLASVKRELVRLKTSGQPSVPFSMAPLENAFTDCERKMRSAAVDAVRQEDGTIEIANRIAVTMQTPELQPGKWVSGKGIFIGEFDLVDGSRKPLGVKTRWYDAAIEFGKPMTFEEAVVVVYWNDENGRGGLRLDPARYEADLFEKLKTGEGIGKHVIAPLEVVREIFKLRDSGEYKRLSEGNLPGKLAISSGGLRNAHWQWSCTTRPRHPDIIRAVQFTDGTDDWDYRDGYRLSVRACFAELVP